MEGEPAAGMEASIIGKQTLRTQRLAPRLLGLAALASSLASAGAARADALDAGKRLYHEFEYDSARIELLHAAELSDPHRRAEAYLYLGLIDAIQGDDAGTLQSFRLALVLDPAVRLPSGVSPKITVVFERVKADVAAAPEARVAPAPPPAPASPGPPPLAAPAPGVSGPTQAQVAAAQRPTAAAPSPAVEASTGAVASATPRSSHGGRWAAGALLVLGVAAASTAIYFGTQEAAAERSFHSATWQTDAGSFQTAANQDALAADLLYAGGAVLGLTGAGLWFAF